MRKVSSVLTIEEFLKDFPELEKMIFWNVQRMLLMLKEGSSLI